MVATDIDGFFDQQAAPLLEVLVGLDIPPERRSEERLREAAMTLWVAQSFGAFRQSPNEREAGSKAACEALEKVHKAAVELQARLEELPFEAADALRHHIRRLERKYDDAAGWTMELNLRRQAVDRALKDLREASEKAAPGDRRTQRVDWLARALSAVYVDLTGAKPTATVGGPFVTTLQRLFDVLDVVTSGGRRPSAEAVTKKLLAQLKEASDA